MLDVAYPLAIRIVGGLARRSHITLETVEREAEQERASENRPVKTYRMADVERILGVLRQRIRRAQQKGALPEAGAREGVRGGRFTVEDIRQIARHFGVTPARPEGTGPQVIAVSNFKGGVGKTTIATHLAQYLARAGMQVLFVDADAQASGTQLLLGTIPDLTLTDRDTLHPFLVGVKDDLRYAVRPTGWPGLDIIPACLGLMGAEYVITGQIADAGGASSFDILMRLREGIHTLADRYDVVIIDCPPALGFLSLLVMYASTSALVPLPPGLLDLCSTAQYFSVLCEVLVTLHSHVGDRASDNVLKYDWVKIVLTRKARRANERAGITAQDELARLVRRVYATACLAAEVPYSAEIESAALENRTVYQLAKPKANYETWRRAVSAFDAVGQEILGFIKDSWAGNMIMGDEILASGDAYLNEMYGEEAA